MCLEQNSTLFATTELAVAWVYVIYALKSAPHPARTCICAVLRANTPVDTCPLAEQSPAPGNQQP